MKIFITLFFCLTLIPAIELYLLILISQKSSFLTVLILTVTTGILGASLAKAQGRETIKQAQANLQTGKIPTQQLLDGILIVIAAVVLVTPGILTDLVGFSILLPPSRAIYRLTLIKLFQNSKSQASFKFNSYHSKHNQKPEDPNDIIINTEAEEVNDHKQLR